MLIMDRNQNKIYAWTKHRIHGMIVCDGRTCNSYTVEDKKFLRERMFNMTNLELKKHANDVRKTYPDRHIDCGIAEANMMGVAAGLSLTGMIPFVSPFAMFAAGRAFEQVRNSIGYPHLNVKIGATHAGITVGEDGASHQCNEDIALMSLLRSIP